MARPTRLSRQQQRIIRDLIAKHDPLIRQAFEAAVQNAHGAVDFPALVQAIEANNLARVVEMLRFNQAMLWPLEEAIRTAVYAGGAAVTLPKGIAGSFSFNGRHPRAEQIIAEAGARLVTEIGSPGVEPIRAVILQGQQEGIGAQKTARRLAGTINPRMGVREGGIMGLDGPRAQRSARVREILNDPDQIADYFKTVKGKQVPRYTSTDRRFDAQVRKAIAEGRALDKTTVERIAKAHDARLLKARGQTIAKNEAFTAQAQGRNEAYQQLMDGGKVESISKRWDHNSAKDPRHDHRVLDGVEVGLNEVFPLGGGLTIRYAHDPDAPADERLGCRCTTVFIPQYRRPNS